MWFSVQCSPVTQLISPSSLHPTSGDRCCVSPGLCLCLQAHSCEHAPCRVQAPERRCVSLAVCLFFFFNTACIFFLTWDDLPLPFFTKPQALCTVTAQVWPLLRTLNLIWTFDCFHHSSPHTNPSQCYVYISTSVFSLLLPL